MTKTKKQGGLKRYHKPINYQVPITTHASSSREDSTAYDLEKHILLLDLIIRRAKNQHGSQHFFKHVRILRRALKQLQALQAQLEDLSAPSNKNSADDVRRKFEQEVTLRGQREVVEEHIRQVLVPKCYVVFSTVVADRQFANLGVVLMGLLAGIVAGKAGIGLPLPQNVTDEPETADGLRTYASLPPTDESLVVGISTRVTGEDHGEIVERRYGYEPGIKREQDYIVTAQTQPQVMEVMKPGKNTNSVTKGVDAEETETVSNTSNSKTHVHDGKKTKTSKEKKSRKEKNALDDLFSNLI